MQSVRSLETTGMRLVSSRQQGRLSHCQVLSCNCALHNHPQRKQLCVSRSFFRGEHREAKPFRTQGTGLLRRVVEVGDETWNRGD